MEPAGLRLPSFPAELSAIRHGESMANAAFAAAAAGRADSGLTGPDAEIPLSPLGRLQSRAVGGWLAALPADRRPQVVYVSPYLRARQTADLALAALREGNSPAPTMRVDDRLRDRAMGVLELLTPEAVCFRYPDEVDRRQRDGELHYRPPGGESMADLGERVGAAAADLARRHGGARVLLITHDAVVVMLRCALAGTDLETVLAEGLVGNASLTTWRPGPDGLRLKTYNRPLAAPTSQDAPASRAAPASADAPAPQDAPASRDAPDG